jgi:hypothetical protein
MIMILAPYISLILTVIAIYVLWKKKTAINIVLCIFLYLIAIVSIGFVFIFNPFGTVLAAGFLVSFFIIKIMSRKEINAIIIATVVFATTSCAIYLAYISISPYAYLDIGNSPNAYKDIWIAYLLIALSGIIIYGYAIISILKKRNRR